MRPRNVALILAAGVFASAAALAAEQPAAQVTEVVGC